MWGQSDERPDFEESEEEEFEEAYVDGEECDDFSEGSDDDGLAIDSMQDIVGLDLSRIGPEELSRLYFASLELAFLFYNWYGRINGFLARMVEILRNSKGEVVQQTFMCHRQ